MSFETEQEYRDWLAGLVPGDLISISSAGLGYIRKVIRTTDTQILVVFAEYVNEQYAARFWKETGHAVNGRGHWLSSLQPLNDLQHEQLLRKQLVDTLRAVHWAGLKTQTLQDILTKVAAEQNGSKTKRRQP